jgi:hypothetical protein
MPDRKYLNLGQVANDGTGDTLRDAADKIEFNFGQLYGKFSAASMLSSGIVPAGVSTIVLNSASPITVDVPDGSEVGEALTFINTQLTTITFTGRFQATNQVQINRLQAIIFVWSGNDWAVVSGV